MPNLRDQMIGQPGGFRQPITPDTTQDQAAGGIEIEEVPHADEHGAGAFAGAEGHANDLPPMQQRSPRATQLAGLPMGADEDAFGAADGGQAADHAQVGGDAEAPGVGASLAIAHEGVGTDGEAAQGVAESGSLTEGEEARDVGEGDAAACQLDIDHLVGFRVPEDHGGHAGAAAVGEGGIHSGDVARRVEWWFLTHPACEPFLEGDGIPGCELPGMRRAGDAEGHG